MGWNGIIGDGVMGYSCSVGGQVGWGWGGCGSRVEFWGRVGKWGLGFWSGCGSGLVGWGSGWGSIVGQVMGCG